MSQVYNVVIVPWPQNTKIKSLLERAQSHDIRFDSDGCTPVLLHGRHGDGFP